MSSKIDYSFAKFGPFLFKSSLPDKITNNLLEEGLKCKESHNHKLAGHLDNQFAYPNEFIKEFYEDFAPYIKAYRHGHCNYHELDPNVPIEIAPVDLWVNFMKSGDFNPLHTHGYDLSFVIYLNVPEEITKENQSYQGASAGPGAISFNYTQKAYPEWATTEKHYLPKKGDLFIFPALLQHWVAPYKSNVTRISVSGNIAITNKSKFPKNYF